MSRRYDQSTTTFSPEGRLHQVEYAIEAINNAGTCVGLLSLDGIVLAAEKKVVSKLLAPSKTSEKTYTIDSHVVSLVAGLTSDANILVQQSRLGSQRYIFLFFYQ
jgi:20S proteasome subunit alpha 3